MLESLKTDAVKVELALVAYAEGAAVEDVGEVLPFTSNGKVSAKPTTCYHVRARITNKTGMSLPPVVSTLYFR